MYLRGKTAIVTGSSRGIGRAIALRLAREGANVVVAAKTDSPHPTLPGTIHDAAEEIRALDVEALAVRVDVRESSEIEAMVEQTLSAFGRIDVLVNNAGAINLTRTENIDVRRIELMLAVNVRAVLECAKHCIPHMKKVGRGHILNLSPPIRLEPRWFMSYAPYTVSRYATTMATVGLAAELAQDNIGVNSLWPKTTIATSAMEVPGMPPVEACRTPEIVADAAFEIIDTEPRRLSGQALIDEDVLVERRYGDLDRYAVRPGTHLMPDLFVG